MSLEKKLGEKAEPYKNAFHNLKFNDVLKELGLVADKILSEIDVHLNFDIDSDRIINPATIHQIKDELKKRVKALLVEDSKET